MWEQERRECVVLPPPLTTFVVGLEEWHPGCEVTCTIAEWDDGRAEYKVMVRPTDEYKALVET